MSVIKDLPFATMRANSEKNQGDFDGDLFKEVQKENEPKPPATIADWNTLQNKPFGDLPTGGDTLTWDGNTEGLEVCNECMYRVSDVVPSLDDLKKGITVSLMAPDGTIQSIEVLESDVVELFDGFYNVGNVVHVITETAAVTKGTPSGTYFMYDSSIPMNTISLTIPGYTGFPVTKKIEEKYLPDRGPIYLYADAEHYLYATEDTSDINKRVTCQQFESFIDSGRLVMLKYVDSNGGIGCFYPSMLNISSNGVGEFVAAAGAKFHTAEYVAE